jgi:hypothetical protein
MKNNVKNMVTSFVAGFTGVFVGVLLYWFVFGNNPKTESVDIETETEMFWQDLQYIKDSLTNIRDSLTIRVYELEQVDENLNNEN